MKIEGIKFSDHFKEEVKEAVKLMVKNNEKSKALNSILGEFTVSVDKSLGGQVFYACSGEELGVPEVKNIYVLKK